MHSRSTRARHRHGRHCTARAGRANARPHVDHRQLENARHRRGVAGDHRAGSRGLAGGGDARGVSAVHPDRAGGAGRGRQPAAHRRAGRPRACGRCAYRRCQRGDGCGRGREPRACRPQRAPSRLRRERRDRARQGVGRARRRDDHGAVHRRDCGGARRRAHPRRGDRAARSITARPARRADRRLRAGVGDRYRTDTNAGRDRRSPCRTPRGRRGHRAVALRRIGHARERGFVARRRACRRRAGRGRQPDCGGPARHRSCRAGDG